MRIICLILLLCCAGNIPCLAFQNPDSLLAMGQKTGERYISALSKKSAGITEGMDKQTGKYLAQLEKQEARLKKKLIKIDSVAAKNIFTDSKQQYDAMRNKLQSKSTALLTKTHKYMPWLDSASSSLKFLEKNPVFAQLNAGDEKLKGAIGKVKDLENQFKQAANVKEFIQQRKAYLKERLQQYDLGKELKNYNKTAYYYSQQLNEYRQALNEPDKAERKALELLNRIPAFQQFMKKNSMLASLFAIPGAEGDPTAAIAGQVPGLQTRNSVNQMIQGQLNAGGPNAQAMFQSNMQEAQGYISSLKSKLMQAGSNSGGDLETPDFKPNPQKTKSFLKRLEYGTNIQSAKSNYYFPTTTDIALSVGYKLNAHNVIGIAASYKMGWGKDIRHIHISSEGIGLRSFIDIKLKGSFFASGGLEFNYQQPFNNMRELYRLQDWQQSGLLGVSKIVSLKTKYFKKTKLQFLWDALSYRQSPRAQPFKFRVGYNF